MKVIRLDIAQRLGVDHVPLAGGRAAVANGVKVPRFTGLGDVLETVFRAVGIAKVAKALELKPGGCGCAARRDALNRAVPFSLTKAKSKSNIS